MKYFSFTIFLLATCVGMHAQTAPAQTNGTDYLTPFPAHHVVANVYFVGTKGMAVYLVTTPQGHILINAGLEDSVQLTKQSVEKLGFKFSDVKILLINHAHFDHCAGSFQIKELTGAKYMVMEPDVPVIEAGGKNDFQYGNTPSALFKPMKVDRVLHDGDEVKLGGTTLTARLTPGHTKGCTTWTMKAKEGSKTYDVVIVGSPNVNPGYKLVNNALYPDIVSDYEKMFRVLKSLPCDVFLGAHGNYYGMEAKYAKVGKGAENPFVDPAGYRAALDRWEQSYRRELARQTAAAK